MATMQAYRTARKDRPCENYPRPHPRRHRSPPRRIRARRLSRLLRADTSDRGGDVLRLGAMILTFVAVLRSDANHAAFWGGFALAGLFLLLDIAESLTKMARR